MSAGVQHRRQSRPGRFSRQARSSSHVSQANSRQQHLSETLRRASEIAAAKAKQAKAEETRGKRRHTGIGALLIVMGIVGVVATSVTGLAQTMGLFSTLGVGMASVALGALVLSSNPQAKTATQNSYAVHALGLAQMSAALRN